MTAPLDLKALREVAERATQGYWRWADWSATFGTMENPDHMFCLESVEEDVGPAPRVRKRIEPRCERVLYIEDPVERPEDARHIAAFHPAACLALLDRCERAEALLPTPVELNGLRAVHFNEGPYGEAAEHYADRIVDALRPPGPTPDDADPRRVHRQDLRSQLATAIAERDEAIARAERLEREMAECSPNTVLALAVERQTAEAIAAWIDRDVVGLHDEAESEADHRLAEEYRDMAKALADLTAAIRSGAYKPRAERKEGE